MGLLPLMFFFVSFAKQVQALCKSCLPMHVGDVNILYVCLAFVLPFVLESIELKLELQRQFISSGLEGSNSSAVFSF